MFSCQWFVQRWWGRERWILGMISMGTPSRGSSMTSNKSRCPPDSNWSVLIKNGFEAEWFYLFMCLHFRCSRVQTRTSRQFSLLRCRPSVALPWMSPARKSTWFQVWETKSWFLILLYVVQPFWQRHKRKKHYTTKKKKQLHVNNWSKNRFDLNLKSKSNKQIIKLFVFNFEAFSL